MLSSLNKDNIWRLQPNYSRYPGDALGLLDSNMHYNGDSFNFLNKQKADYWDEGNQVYTVDAFLHLVTGTNGKNIHDPLARPWATGNTTNPFHFMRMMELMAVWPDAFDITYYSIFGNYMSYYFPKVCNRLMGSPPGSSHPSCDLNNPPEGKIAMSPDWRKHSLYPGGFRLALYRAIYG